MASNFNCSRLLALVACSFVLTGCFEGARKNTGTSSAAPPAVAAESNRAPTISGVPVTSVKSQQPYTFKPVASDPDGDKLTFSITNKPAWATFDTLSGTLSGTPSSAYTGKFAAIRISASDGKTTSALPEFDILVAATTAGSATLSWQPPTQYTDGSPLADLAGYVVRYGTSATSLTYELRVTNPGLTTTIVENLAPATWYFTVSAYTTKGVESAPSATSSKTVT